MEERQEFPVEPPENHSDVINCPARRQALRRGDLLDRSANDTFDSAVRIATRIVGAPVGLVSFVDGNRQFFKASLGLNEKVAAAQETALSHSFCQYVVSADTPLSVEDARVHPLMKENPAIEDLGVVAYLGVPVHGTNGETLGSFCAIDNQPREWTQEDVDVLSDLSGMLEVEIALRGALDDRQLLLQEINHRMKNVFALVSGIVRMNARTENDVASFAALLEERFQALTRAHELIVPMVNVPTHRGQSISLSALISTLMAPYFDGEGERFSIVGETIQLGPMATTNLALAVHEMATNSTKYGALRGASGQISVSWSIDRDAVRFSWCESGIGDAGGKTVTGGFGSRLIQITVEQQLGGTVEVKSDDDRFEQHFTFSIENLLA